MADALIGITIYLKHIFLMGSVISELIMPICTSERYGNSL